MHPILFQKAAMLRVLFFSLAILLTVTAGGWQAARAGIRLDNSYAPILAKPNNGPDSVVLLPDGKFLAIRLSSQNVLGAQEYKVTRFNADGGVDQKFDAVVMNRGDGKLLLQPDGKILVVFFDIFAGGQNRGGAVRLNADGSLDSSFNASWLTGAVAYGALLQPDGRVLVGGYITVSGSIFRKMVRLNADGSRDFSFSDNASGTPLALQTDGKILANSDNGSDNPMHRLNVDGTPDTAFDSLRPQGWATGHVYSIIIQPDNKILVGGADIIRLSPNGSRDTSFDPGLVYNQYQIYAMVRQPDGKIVIGGNPYMFNVPTTMTRKRLTRINADGSQDNTFDAMAGEDYGFDNLLPRAVRPNGTILVSGSLSQNSVTRYSLVSLNQTGGIDQTFSADFGKTGAGATTAFKQPDGKILVAGDFTEVSNFSTSGLARLNANGTVDTGFSFSNQITGRIDTIAVQADGKVLIGGNFRFNNQRNYGVFRLNPNGSIDSGFTPNVLVPLPIPYYYPYGIRALAVQTDGKILVGGNFTDYANSGRERFVRLNPDGSVDAAYNVTSSGVQRMLVQPDGKIVVVGTLTQNGNTTRENPRLNTDGSFDPTFNASPNVSDIFDLAANGKFSAVSYDSAGSHTTVRAHRLNNDGSEDTSFAVTDVGTNTSLSELIFQPDGRMIFKTSSDAGRLKLNGGIEAYFHRNSLDARKFLISGDNNLIVVGRFTSIGGTRRAGIARFLLNAADFDFDGDGKADISVFRPSAGDWYLSLSGNNQFLGTHFGASGDLIAPADFDGDGKTDISVFRPSTGSWYRLNSSDNSFSAVQFGAAGDLPVPADFDGDGRADVAVYRPSAGSWFRVNSGDNQSIGVQFGVAEDKPIVGDFDGDGKADLTVYRPSNGSWYRINSFNQQFVGAQFGVAEDKPVAADYDGDGKTDLAVYRPSNGYWYRINSSSNSFAATQFGVAEDKPAPADFDGDGLVDLAVFRPSTGTWYLLRTTAGFTGAQFGANGDVPAPNAFVR